MKKILFLLLFIPSLTFGQFLRLPYSYLLHNYQGDTIKQYFSGDSAKWYTDKGFFSFGKPIYSAGKKLITTIDTTNKWLPKTSAAANSALIQGKDTTWIKAQGGGSTIYAKDGLNKDGDTIKLNKSIFIPADSTFQIYVDNIRTFMTSKASNETAISSPLGTNIVVLDDNNETFISGSPINIFSGLCPDIIKFTTSVGIEKAKIDSSGNASFSGQIKCTQFSGSLTDGTPAASEINSIVGTASTKGAGFQATIKDTDGSGLLYKVESDGTYWYYTVMTKAL